MSVSQLPVPGSYLSSIRESSRKICQSSKITFNKDAIERLIFSDVYKLMDKAVALPGVALPLNFASPLDELNVLSLLAILNFGSSYDSALRAKTGHGSSNAVRALIFSMYITSNPSEGDYLSAEGLKLISDARVAELIGVDLHVEKSHPTLHGVTVGELGGPLYGYVKLLTRVLNETGSILLDSGYPNLGSLVAEALKEGEKAKLAQGPSAHAEVVIEKLARALPAFQDMALVDGEPVYIFSKAIYLLNVISTRFGSITPPPFPIPDVKDLPFSADGTSPSIFVHLGIIDISSSDTLKCLWPVISDEDIQRHLDQQKEGVAAQAPVGEGPSVSLEQAFRLRAAAIVASETIVDVAKETSPVTPLKINIWLQSVVRKRPDYKACGSILAKNTVFF